MIQLYDCDQQPEVNRSKDISGLRDGLMSSHGTLADLTRPSCRIGWLAVIYMSLL